MASKSTTEELLSLLRRERIRDPQAGWVSALRCRGIVGDAAGQRISELRADGWEITATRLGGSSMAHYRLENLNRGAPIEARRQFYLRGEMIAALARGELPDEVIQEARRLYPGEQRKLF